MNEPIYDNCCREHEELVIALFFDNDVKKYERETNQKIKAVV